MTEPSKFSKHECRFCHKTFPSLLKYSQHFGNCIWFRADAPPEVEWKLTETDKDYLQTLRINSDEP